MRQARAEGSCHEASNLRAVVRVACSVALVIATPFLVMVIIAFESDAAIAPVALCLVVSRERELRRVARLRRRPALARRQRSQSDLRDAVLLGARARRGSPTEPAGRAS